MCGKMQKYRKTCTFAVFSDLEDVVGGVEV
jgi:hypothetical protein